MKGGGSREPPPFLRRSSFLPLFFPIPCECPAGPIRRDIPIYKENFPFLPLYKLGKDCYNIQAVKKHAPVAQWIEHRIPVPRVGGSSPFRRTKKADTLLGVCFFGISEERTRKADPGAAGVKNSPVDCFSGRGRVHRRKTAPWKGCWLSSITHPKWSSALLVYAGRDSKGRPERSEGNKVSSGHFISPWESPSVSRCIP